MLLLLKDGSVDAILKRCTVTMRGMTRYEVQSTSTLNGQSVKGLLVLDSQARLIYRATQGANSYTLSITPAGYREVEQASRMYEDFDYPGRVRLYASRLSPLFKTLPNWLLGVNPSRLFPANSPVKVVGTETIDGKTCDKLQATSSGPMGSGVYDLSVAQSGLIYRYHSRVQTPNGLDEKEWTLSGYRTLSSFSPTEFSNPIPDGFVPFALPDHYGPVEIGKPLYLRGWFASKTKQPWNPKSGQAVLFVLTGADSLPCKRAVKALTGWASQIKSKGVDLAIGIDEVNQADAKGFLYDPDKRSLKEMGAPSTPMFYLVDGKGVVRNLWMGFDNDKADKFLSDLLAAIASLK